MNETALAIHGLGKKYQIGTLKGDHKDSFKQMISDLVLAPFRRGWKVLRGEATAAELGETIWAVKDVSFEVKRGEVVGIIGRNGAGKSTLLKLLSRITSPSEGTAEIHGRVGSLLEVGTGFHPELTGRENTYLNGAILGMSRTEIDEKLDDIIAFAEIEKFVDTPVKHYSSGMFVRLAFAVASHLEPEILFVDEVLSVGDKAFQDKCLNKMDNIAGTGRTILFVSHNMFAVTNLCSRVIYLEGGRVVMDGPAREVVQAYLNQGELTTGRRDWQPDEGPGNDQVKLSSLSIRDKSGKTAKEIKISEEARVEMVFDVLKDDAQVQFSLTLFDANGYCVMSSLSNREPRYHGKALKKGRYKASCTIYGNYLNNGRYHLTVVGASKYWLPIFELEHILAFDALEDNKLKGDYSGTYGGTTRPAFDWTMDRIEHE